MKALVLSGGSGTRLRPFSHSMPKQLIPIGNRPVLEHVLGNIRELGVTEIAIIVGDRAEQIRAAFGDGSRLGVRITYIQQEQPLGLAHCVLLASDFLGTDPFVMYLGDNVLLDGVADIAAQFRGDSAAARVVVYKVADPRAFGVAELDANGNLERLVEKPQHPRSDLAMIGVYFFTAAIHDAVRAIRPSARGELEITDAIQWLVSRGDDVQVSEYRGFWRDAGEVDDVLDCNRRLLRDLRSAVLGEVGPGSVLHGAVELGPGARVVGSRIEGPVIIGADTVVEDSYLGPYTAVGRGCALADCALAESIVLDGATIAHTGLLRRSVIGRHAVVGSSGNGGRDQRLIIGDHARVDLAS
ncbi:MAG TPA: glucose-1-phosphate thymidylyltransferase [Micromonosporaceae bacterium]